MSDQNFENWDDVPKELEGRIPTIRVVAMPADANPFGDIFGGWIVSHMDMSGGVHAYKQIKKRVVTVGIDAMTFHKPVFVGDEVSFYTKIEKIGRTSITMKVESWAFRRGSTKYDKVTEGMFTYVHIDEQRKPAPIKTAKS